MPTDDEIRQRIKGFGPRIKSLRQDRNLTVRDLAARCGLASSTISKIENDRMSPTYDSIVRLAAGLDMGPETLIDERASQMGAGRRSVTRAGEGIPVRTERYDYELLSADISSKHFFPIVATIPPGPATDQIRHRGEEFIYVLSGSVQLLTELYAPLTLKVGDSCYFDSSMGHRLVAVGDEAAKILWVASELSVQLANQTGQDLPK